MFLYESSYFLFLILALLIDIYQVSLKRKSLPLPIFPVFYTLIALFISKK